MRERENIYFISSICFETNNLINGGMGDESSCRIKFFFFQQITPLDYILKSEVVRNKPLPLLSSIRKQIHPFTSGLRVYAISTVLCRIKSLSVCVFACRELSYANINIIKLHQHSLSVTLQSNSNEQMATEPLKS